MRSVFAFHRLDPQAKWLAYANPRQATEGKEGAPVTEAPASFLTRLQHMPPLVTERGEFKLWSAQITAIRNLEASLSQNKPGTLIQMATGAGKTSNDT